MSDLVKKLEQLELDLNVLANTETEWEHVTAMKRDLYEITKSVIALEGRVRDV